MKAGAYKLKKLEKLNLVPILDSVFIFIFFLLMSAQFVEVFEIGSSVPMTKKMKEEKLENEPLNLTLELTSSQIIIKTGLKNTNARTFATEQKEEIRAYLSELKQKHPKENTMILKANKNISFQHLVTVIDSTQARKGTKEKFFEKIVFDNNGAGE